MTAPDPKTVREIAREAVQRAARRRDYIGPAITDHDIMRKILASGDRSAWGRWNDAVRTEMETATVTVSWPDEQQPADAVNAEQQQDGAVGGKGSERAASLLAFLDLHRERRGHDVIASLAVGDGRTVELTQVQLRAVLAERTALAARVAELEGERDLWRTRAYQVGNMFIGERDPEVVPFLGVPGQEPAATETEEC